MIVYAVVEERLNPGKWRVVGSNIANEETYVAVFSGPDAEKRARDYAAWMNGGRG